MRISKLLLDPKSNLYSTAINEIAKDQVNNDDNNNET